MIALAADENLNQNIIRGVRRRRPTMDFVTVQEAGLAGENDPAVLEWAAKEDRVLFTHDAQTMVGHAYERIDAGLRMPGVFQVPKGLPLRSVIDDILLDCRVQPA